MTRALCHWLRNVIYWLYVNSNTPTNEIHRFLVTIPNMEIHLSEDYLTRLVERLVSDPLFRDSYLAGPKRSSGRPCCLSIPKNTILLTIANFNFIKLSDR